MAPQRRVVIESSLGPVTTRLELDASVTETHRSTAEVTQHPVEVGADLTDHVRAMAQEIDIVGVVSNTPVPLDANVVLPSVPGGDPTSRAEDAVEALARLQATGTLCTVTTTLKSYRNMYMLALSTTRDASRGNVAELQMTWTEVRFAATKRVASPVPQTTTGASKKSLGKQGTTTATAEEQRSVLFQFFGTGG